MNTIKAVSERLTSLRLWVAVLAAAAVGAGAYFGFNQWSGSNPAEGTSQTQLVPVTRGSLVNDVSVTGTLAYTTRETVAFRQQGFVSDISVSEGDRVSSGDPLALLDAETIANLDRGVAQARIEVRDAEENLQDALSPYTSAQIARAELDVAMARLELRNANEDFDGLGKVSADIMAQARLAIVTAQLDLDDAVDSRSKLITPTSQEVARAQLQVTGAQLVLQDAQNDLDALLNPSESEIAEAESEVAKARLDLDTAIETLDSLVTVTAIELAMARTAVSDAELEYRASLAAIHELETWAIAGAVRALQDSIDAAQDSLLRTKRDLRSAKGNAEEALQAASAKLDAAKGDYFGYIENLLGMDLTQQILHPPDELLAALGVELGHVFNDIYIEELQAKYVQGELVDSPETPWNEVVVHSLAMPSAGEGIVECMDPEDGPDQACISGRLLEAYNKVLEETARLEAVRVREAENVRIAEEAVLVAEEALESADQDLDLYIAEASEEEASEATVPEVRALVEALALAKANLENLKEELAILLDSPDPLELDFRQREVATAETRLADSLESLSSLMNQPDPLLLETKSRSVATAAADLRDAEAAMAELVEVADSDVELADREIEVARATLVNAEEALSSLLADPDAVDQLVKQASVRVAQESLAEAESTLAEFSTVDQLEIGLREAELAAARTSLETAVTDLERATLRATIDGIVVSVNIEVGQQVNVNTQAIEIADPYIVEVSGSVDEIDVLFLQVGAQAFVSLEALGGQTLSGTVSSIANSGVSQQGVVTYPVTIRVDSSETGQLPEGLSATAQIIIRERSDAILIPLQALYGTVQEPLVRVVVDDDLVEKQVSLGIGDDFWVVVEEGLDEGEVVSMEVVGSSTSQFGGFGPGFRTIGGFGGGLGGRGEGPGGGSNP